jgi:hypothetical protein
LARRSFIKQSLRQSQSENPDGWASVVRRSRDVPVVVASLQQRRWHRLGGSFVAAMSHSP